MHEVVMVVAVVLYGARCAPPPGPQDDPPVDAGPRCARACARLDTNHCPEGLPTEAGTPCETICENALTDLYDLECVAELPGCDLVPCQLAP